MIPPEGHWSAEKVFLRPESWDELTNEVLNHVWRTKLVGISVESIPDRKVDDLDVGYSRVCREIFRLLSSAVTNRSWGEHHREKWIEVRSSGDADSRTRQRSPHNDEAGMREPADIALMYAVMPAASGGTNEYLSTSVLWKRLMERNPQLAWKLLSVSVRFDVGSRCWYAPILRKTGAGVAIHYNRALIDGDSGAGVAKEFETFLADMPATDFFPMPLRAGDAVIWWDSYFLHNRTASTLSAGGRHLRKVGIVGCEPGWSRTSVKAGERCASHSNVSARQTAVEELGTILSGRRQRLLGRPLVVGIDGPCASGKTTLAVALEANLRSAHGHHTLIVHVDDFHRPRSKRHQDANRSRAFFDGYFDIDRLERRVLRPLREKGVLDAELTVLDFSSDEYTRTLRFQAHARSIVIVEGVFLLRPEIRRWLDFSVYVSVQPGVAYSRAISRKLGVEAFTRTSAKFFDRYLLASLGYNSDTSPWAIADALVDNDDLANPKLSLSSENGCF
jgi:uridine kinase